MKITNGLFTVAGIALLLSIGSIASNNVSAADGDIAATANTTAKFSITDGNLELQSVPDLNFGTHSVQEIMEKSTLGLESDGNNKVANIKVSNYKVAANGWRLTASATPFKNGNEDLTGAQLSITPQEATTKLSAAATDTDTTKATSTSATDIIGKEGTVLTGHPALGITTAAVSAGTDAELDLSGVTDKAKLVSGNYKSTITWTLEEGAQAAAAKL